MTSHRGLAVAQALALRGSLPLRLVHVCTPPADPEAAEARLHQYAARAFPVACTVTVRQAPEVDEALMALLSERPGALVVMGTRARHAVGEILVGSVAESMLALNDRPFVLAGPRVAPTERPSPDRLVIGVDSHASAEVLTAAVQAWRATFGSEAWVVQVAEPAAVAGLERPIETALVRRTATALGDDGGAPGGPAQWDVLHGDDPADALTRYAGDLGGGYLAVASTRWADAHQIHWRSTTRRLVHRSPYPVLVVPVHG